MSYSSLLIIQELGSSGNDKPRQLILVGSGLPHMGAEWSLESNLVTTWYNGNGDEATQQNLGPREMPSHWTGEWHRTVLRRTPCTYIDETGSVDTQLVDPMSLWSAFDTIQRAGFRLRVTWAVSSDVNDPSQQGRVVREGRIKTFKAKVTRVQDIEWEVEFHWVGRGITTQRVASTRSRTVVGDTGALQAQINKLIALNNAAANAKNLPKQFTLGQLEQVADYPSKLTTAVMRKVQQTTSTLGDLVDIAKTLESQPAHVIAAVVNQAHNSISQLNNFQDSLGQVPYELMTNRDRVDSMLRAARQFGDFHDAAVDAARAARTLAQQLQLQLAQAPLTGAVDPKHASDAGFLLGVYVCVDGDTPQKVSLRFYGTPDHSVDILRANRLPLYQPTFKRGKILIIPQLSAQGAGSNGSQGA